MGKVNVMIYVMSDLHGCLKEFLKMLDLIGFSTNDELYIIGDVIDRGASPIKLLRLIMDTPNMHLILGNHELMMRNSICNPSLSDKEKERFMKTEAVMQNRNVWLKNGGVVTERQYSKLKWEDKIKVYHYLNSLPMMKEVQVQNTAYLLIHGGIYEGFKEDYEEGNLSEDILWSYFPRLNEEDVIIPGKTVVVGHTPTSCYGYDNKIISVGDKRLIDCGCVFGYSLGCLCMDDEECFYVKNWI